MFKPAADLTNITTGKSQRKLEKSEYGFRTNKNLSFDISETFQLNALQLNDSIGDNVVLKLSVPFAGVSL